MDGSFLLNLHDQKEFQDSEHLQKLTQLLADDQSNQCYIVNYTPLGGETGAVLFVKPIGFLGKIWT